jgi:hypothetical protein
MNAKPRYWFPAKTYGWGWGIPNRWEGWVVLGGYVALMVAGVVLIKPHVHPVGFMLYATILSLALAAICWRTGEPPRWRWGE